MIKSLLEKIEQKRKEETQKRFFEIRHWITKFFEDLAISKGSVELPAWVECQNLMRKMDIHPSNKKVVDFYYSKLQKHKVLGGFNGIHS